MTGWQNYRTWLSSQTKASPVVPGGRVLFGLPGPVGRRVVFNPSNSDKEISDEVEEALRHVTYEAAPARAGPALIWE